MTADEVHILKEMVQTQVSGNSSMEEKENSTNAAASNQQTSKDSNIPDRRVQEALIESEWQPVLDDHSGEYYYWNVRTGETTWVKPVECGSADELGNLTPQSVNFDSSSHTSPEQSPVQMQTKVDCGESSPAKGITSLASTEAEPIKFNAESVSGKDDLAGDAPMVAQKLENTTDPESTVGSMGSLQEGVDCEGEDLKEEVGEKKNEESEPKIKNDKKDFNIGNASDMQEVPEKTPQSIDIEISSRSSPLNPEVTKTCQLTTGDDQDISGCRSNLLPSEVTRTVEDKMASLMERAESLHYRVKGLARESCRGVSRHMLMASQTEARLTDWKAFCALGFVPEACLSFIQSELTQLEQVLTAEEANELERQKSIDLTSTLEASHELRPEVRDADWSSNWAYYQQDNSATAEHWKQGQLFGFTANGADVEEGEIQTSYAEFYPAYGNVCEGPTAVKVFDDPGTEDVNMDVDMEVDDEVEVEPAVPGTSSDVPASNVPAPFSYTYPLPGSNDVSILAPLDSTCVGEPTPYYQSMISGNSWAPPLPPDDEWAPPPPGESEPAPPPPPDEPPPLPSQSPEVVENLVLPSMSSEAQLQYFVPGYSLENNALPQCVSVADYQSAVDSLIYGSYVEGGVYSNCSQSTETLNVEQPYVVASVPTPVFNGWTAPVIASMPSSLVNPMSSEVPVKAVSYASSAPMSTSVTADSNIMGASLEVKKLRKGKIKKRTHAVAAAPMLNKKVSSLVSKWKQAKEELHAGEDEDEDKALFDVEVLEKKRQKEIEEWRRQQIASGEALDNANFQPLGTLDWRERVKRARKADSKEGKEGTTDSVALSMVEGQNADALKLKKPNLADLSKGLPAGWQAYWDEASGEVYYGNLITQETTWDRPVT
ncbi:hypothetical protein L7F22_069268 [Adiantum nelumboides]|nr:hypothetical protein [Adiantum nelumboides]